MTKAVFLQQRGSIYMCLCLSVCMLVIRCVFDGYANSDCSGKMVQYQWTDFTVFGSQQNFSSTKDGGDDGKTYGWQ